MIAIPEFPRSHASASRTLLLLALLLNGCGGGGSDDTTSLPPPAAANSAIDTTPNGAPSTPADIADSADSGTGDGDSGDSGVTETDPADSLAAKSSFSAADIRHFLARTQFGIEAGKTDEVLARGLDGFIDDMMLLPSDPQPFETTAALLLADEDDPLELSGKFPGSNDVSDWNIQLMINNPNGFQEVLGMFWQDYFGVDVQTMNSTERHLMVDYINLLRRQGAGSFRDLFLNVSRHGAMLIFLDGADNSKFAPNENYAREFWELFSLGVDNGYSEADIIESSRAFTGWRRQFDPVSGLTEVVFDPESKAVGSKFPLSMVVEHNLAGDDYERMVDLTLSHTDQNAQDLTARYLARKLLIYFATATPSEELVSQMARTLRENDLHIGAALKTLFLSEAFYAPQSREQMVRDFYEQAIGLVRSTGLTESSWAYRRYLGNMHSLPAQPPSVEGWPEGNAKITAQGNGIEMPNFVNELLTNRANQSDAGYDIAAALQPPEATGPEPVVDHVADLLGVVLDDTERDLIIDFMNIQVDNEGNETPLNYTPQNTDHQDRKLRNLLWILTQHPTFHTK